MTTYYRDDEVRVTSSGVEMHGVAYPLARLEYVWHPKGKPDAGAMSRKGLRLLLLRTSDSLRFGRVYRALERALENHPE